MYQVSFLDVALQKYLHRLKYSIQALLLAHLGTIISPFRHYYQPIQALLLANFFIFKSNSKNLVLPIAGACVYTLTSSLHKCIFRSNVYFFMRIYELCAPSCSFIFLSERLRLVEDETVNSFFLHDTGSLPSHYNNMSSLSFLPLNCNFKNQFWIFIIYFV